MRPHVKGVNKFTNEWTVQYGSGLSFRWKVSAAFSPVEYKFTPKKFQEIIGSNLKPSEKVVLCHLYLYLFTGTTVSLYSTMRIAKLTGLSYNTVKQAIARLENLGLIIHGKILTVKGNIANQYMVKPDVKLCQLGIDEMYASEEEPFVTPDLYVSNFGSGRYQKMSPYGD